MIHQKSYVVEQNVIPDQKLGISFIIKGIF